MLREIDTTTTYICILPLRKWRRAFTGLALWDLGLLSSSVGATGRKGENVTVTGALLVCACQKHPLRHFFADRRPDAFGLIRVISFRINDRKRLWEFGINIDYKYGVPRNRRAHTPHVSAGFVRALCLYIVRS